MASDWVTDIVPTLRGWLTGEDAKAFVLRHLAEGLAVSHDSEAFQRQADAALRAAEQLIDRGQFARPIDWIKSMNDLDWVAHTLDAERMLQEPAKVSFLKMAFLDLLRVSRERAYADDLAARGGVEDLLADKPYRDAIDFYAEHPAVWQVLRGTDEAFWGDMQAAERAVASVSRDEYAAAYRTILETPVSRAEVDRNLGHPTAGDPQLTTEESDFIDLQIREYNDLKILWLRLFLVEGKKMLWSDEVMHQTLGEWEQRSPFSVAYGRFGRRLMARELLERLSDISARRVPHRSSPPSTVVIGFDAESASLVDAMRRGGKNVVTFGYRQSPSDAARPLFDVLLIGEVEHLKQLADELHAIGKAAGVIELAGVEPAFAIQAIRATCQAIFVFGSSIVSADRRIREELDHAKDSGKAVVRFQTHAASLESVLQQCGDR